MAAVLVYLSAHASFGNLVALQALMEAGGPIATFHPGGMGDCAVTWSEAAFAEPTWCTPAPVLQSARDLLLAARAGRFDVALVQNDCVVSWPDNVELLRALAAECPLVTLDTSDNPGLCAPLADLSSLYLNANASRGQRADARECDAPYLVWGAVAKPRETGANQAEVPRDLDLCFLGSLRTHSKRRGLFATLERAAIRHADQARLALLAAERGCAARLTPNDYRKVLRRSRLCVDLWGNGAVTKRLFEGIASGCLVLSQSPRWRRSHWVPEPGRHILTFSNREDLDRLIDWCISQPDYVAAMAAAAEFWLRSTFNLRSLGIWLRKVLAKVAQNPRLPSRGIA